VEDEGRAGHGRECARTTGLVANRAE